MGIRSFFVFFFFPIYARIERRIRRIYAAVFSFGTTRTDEIRFWFEKRFKNRPRRGFVSEKTFSIFQFTGFVFKKRYLLFLFKDFAVRSIFKCFRIKVLGSKTVFKCFHLKLGVSRRFKIMFA